MPEFVKYLSLRERGLRKDAFERLGRFIATARSWDLSRRSRVVDRLMRLRDDRPAVGDMIPTPLFKDLIDPTLEEWIAHDPADPVPWRWRGGTENLRRAVELSRSEKVARVKLADRLLGEVEMSVHELPRGYLGSPFADRPKLDEVEALLSELSPEEGQGFRRRLDAVRLKVESYVTFLESGSSMTYRNWV